MPAIRNSESSSVKSAPDAAGTFGAGTPLASPSRAKFLFLSAGHFLDHYFVLIFATVAALTLANEWGMTYAQLVPIATPGFLAFGLCSLPAGWIADRWSRDGMMAIFFIGIGAASIACGFVRTPFELSVALLIMGFFGAIYHPVGIPLVMDGRDKTGMPIAINGIFGNLGVGGAALITGYFIDSYGWRTAFYVPGLFSIGMGLAYFLLFQAKRTTSKNTSKTAPATEKRPGALAGLTVSLIMIIVMTSMMGSFMYQSSTFALPKVFDERLGDVAGSATAIGQYVFAVFAIAAFAQVVVGYLLDRFSARKVFMGVAILQIGTFALFSGSSGWTLVAVITGCMIAIFAQIPINEVVLGRLVKPEHRSTIFAARYFIVFVTMGVSLPLLAWLHKVGGFNTLFWTMTGCAVCSLIAASCLPALRPTATSTVSPN